MTTSDPQRILLVDDEPDIRDIATMALETVGGMTVTACAGGRDAIAQLTTARPDVILLDVMMPDMDGPAVLRALRAYPAGQDVPVIFLTAKVRPDEVLRLKGEGADEVFGKPFDPMALADQVRATCRALRAQRRAAGEEALADKTRQLHDRFLSRVRAERGELERLVRALPTVSADSGEAGDLARHAHRLAGTAGTLGAVTIARAAGEIEAALDAGDLGAAERAGLDLIAWLDAGSSDA